MNLGKAVNPQPKLQTAGPPTRRAAAAGGSGGSAEGA